MSYLTKIYVNARWSAGQQYILCKVEGSTGYYSISKEILEYKYGINLNGWTRDAIVYNNIDHADMFAIGDIYHIKFEYPYVLDNYPALLMDNPYKHIDFAGTITDNTTVAGIKSYNRLNVDDLYGTVSSLKSPPKDDKKLKNIIAYYYALKR